MQPKHLKQLAILSVVLGVLMLVMMYGTQYWAKQRALSALPINTKMGGDFVLSSTQGQPLNSNSLRGKVVLLTFGFATCPDVCPLVLARMGQAVRELDDEAGKTQGVFISFDPARDTVDVLKPYVQHFYPSFIGATGTEADIANVAKQYGVVYLKEDTGSASGYGFTHSDYIYLIDQQGRVRKLYDTKAPVAEMTADMHLLLHEHEWF
jgi:protein SCO1/2